MIRAVVGTVVKTVWVGEVNIHSLQGDCSSCRSCHREEEVIVDEKPSAMVIKNPAIVFHLWMAILRRSITVALCCVLTPSLQLLVMRSFHIHTNQ